MNLVASLIVRNELGRYLEPCIRALQSFCDGVAVLDNGSDDGTYEWLREHSRVSALETFRPAFYAHEGRARNALLDLTLEQRPTHVLAIDADEFVTEGQAVRAACEADQGPGVWTLLMEEVWKADEHALWTRQDGGWRTHPLSVLWRVPDAKILGRPEWRIANRQLACGREPIALRKLGRCPQIGSVLHFGWANPAERQVRYDRYAKHDNGRFHASSHLRSILAADRHVRLERRAWPAGLDRDAILERVRREPVAA